MKICAVQVRSEPGKITKNRDRHLFFVQQAIASGCDGIFFPELSLTGYHAGLAEKFATDRKDKNLSPFQSASDEHNVWIGIGVPTKSASGLHISMLIFNPGKEPLIYSKQHLHETETDTFTPGHDMFLLPIADQHVSPAICYESMVVDHTEKAQTLGATLYLASVANSKKGVVEAMDHYAKISKKFRMPVLMANGIGDADNFKCAGGTAAWNSDGELLAQLGVDEEGILIFDTDTDSASVSN